jgi:enamine deaminase RidA (YjgF/YER057c/UK114 family)
MTRVSLLLCGVVVALSGALGAGAEKRAIAPAGVKPIGPYSPGILAGDFLYVSGQGGRDAEGKLPATIEGQARQTLQNVKSIVEAAGLTMEHVVYCQVYLDDMAHHDVMDRVWKEFFAKAPPAQCSGSTSCRRTSRSRSTPSRSAT